jgi:MFS family permease
MAASLVSVMTVVAAASKLLFGRLADMFGARVTTYLALSLQALAVLVLAAGREPLALTVGAVLQGLGYGGLAPLISVLVASVFGRERFAEVIGAVSLLMLPFSLASLPLASLVQDQTGSYAPAYLLFAGLYVLAGTCLALLPFAPLGTARTSGQVARSSA